MASVASTLIRLSDLQDGQEAECFAALVKKVRGVTKKDDPFLTLLFRDRGKQVEAKIWADNRWYNAAQGWVEGIAYRIKVRGEQNPRYGFQIQIFDIRPAGTEEDEADGYDFSDLVESSDFPVADLCGKLQDFISRYIDDPGLKELVRRILREHDDLFCKMPAAQNLHHAFTGGLLEHVWSVTRVAAMLADHYGRYYKTLNPPLNKGVVVAAAILHDIGKLRELEYSIIEARYTKVGQLVGHILMGRDLVRDMAKEVGGIGDETLLLLEHAILAHHGKPEYGAPKSPMTLEAMIVSFIDDLDAKVNVAARHRLNSATDDEFTDKIYAVDNRRFYRGIPIPVPADDDLPPA